MAIFNETQLEKVFIVQFKKQGYDHVHGGSISRDVLLYDDLREFVRKRYSHVGITENDNVY